MMKKIVSLLIISLWLNSCKNPGEPVVHQSLKKI